MGELLILLVLVQFFWIYKLDTQLKDTQDTLNHAAKALKNTQEILDYIAKVQMGLAEWSDELVTTIRDHKKNGS